MVEAQDMPGTFSVGHFPLSFLARDFEEVKVYKLIIRMYEGFLAQLIGAVADNCLPC